MGVIEARRRILLSAPHVEATTPAGVANFQTDLISPLRSLRAGFLPVQSGSGDPSPSNIRSISAWNGLTVTKCGKNLFDVNSGDILNAYLSADIVSSNANAKSVFIKCKANTTYTVSKIAGQRFAVAYTKVLPANSVPIFERTGDLTASSITITTGSDAEYLVAFVYNGSYDTITADEMLASVQIELGSTPTSYSPYTGTTIPVTFPAAGKNLACLPPYIIEQDRTSNDITYHAINKSAVHVQGTATAGSYMVPSGQIGVTRLKAGTYTISTNLPGDNNSRVYITSEMESISYHAAYNGHPVTKTISNNLNDVRVQIYIGSGTTINEDVWVQIELGSTATTYEPFRNAYYGGYVDLVKGEVVAEWRSFDLGSLPWGIRNNGDIYYFAATLPDDVTSNMWTPNAASSLNNYPPHFMSDRFAVVSGSSIHSGTSGDNTIGMDWFRTVRLRCDMYEHDASTFKTAMDGVTVLYELATPITYPITPQIIKSLRGVNNVWSDANGDMSVEYWKH